MPVRDVFHDEVDVEAGPRRQADDLRPPRQDPRRRQRLLHLPRCGPAPTAALASALLKRGEFALQATAATTTTLGPLEGPLGWGLIFHFCSPYDCAANSLARG